MSSTMGVYHHGQGFSSPVMGPISSGISEPMALGSPTTSPTANHGASYLPGFLMGDRATPTPGATQSGSCHAHSRPMQLSPTHVSPGGNGSKSLHPQSAPYAQPTDRPNKRHPTSPPTQSLWSIGQQKQATTPRGDRWETAQPSNGAPFGGIRHSTPSSVNAFGPLSQQRTGNVSQFRSPHVPGALRNPASGVSSPLTNNQNVLTPDRLSDGQKSFTADRMAEECWVTVFGYPVSRAAFILNQFAQFGTIEKHVTTNDGNWMHMKYQNRLQARCAVGRNGRVFGDNIMVGVTPCSNQDVMCERITTTIPVSELEGERENSFVGFISPLKTRLPNATPSRDQSEARPLNRLRTNTSLMNNSYTAPSSAAATMDTKPTGGGGVTRHSSMRSLAGDYRVTGQLNRAASVRQSKDSGLLSKALGYMFGWS